ncbi:hypothetical protein D9619_005240 [Psilocybe cf. subviscida]|uniref:Mid2 domain-containing protein n=1 Tax=Psilocybe cf. subviscida TaxID=2480587 RepID=A0A8H5BX11_9AGAR|nr:hypothetical protein D9619_005240 [Psilocybe cf. subviscida]
MRSMHRGLLIGILTWYSVSPGVVAVPTNWTIDDTFGDPITGRNVLFLPSTQGVWKTQDCSDCALYPDTNQAFMGTYTAATYHPSLGSISATLTFQGTAIYVFFILAINAPPGITTMTAVNFTLDDQPPVARLPDPDVSSDFQYNVMLWSQTGLPATQHKLVVSTSGEENSFYVNFDYAIYTHDDEAVIPATASSSTLIMAETKLSSTASTSNLSSRMATPPLQSSTTTPSTTKALSITTTTTMAIPARLSTVLSSTTTLSVPSIFSTATVSPSPSSLKSEGADTVSGSHQGEIVGGAVGGAFIALAFMLAVLYVHRRHRQPRNRLRFKSKPITSNTQGSTETLRPPSPVNPSPDDSSSTYHSIATLPEDGEIVVSEDLRRGSRFNGQSSSVLSYTSTNDAPATISPAQSEGVRRARQEELDHQLTERQEVMREVLSDLNSTMDRRYSDNRQRHVRSVSVHTLRRLRSFVGHDVSQQEVRGGSGRQPVVAGDANVRGSEGKTEVNVVELQELNRLLRLEIEFLKLQQESAWAQGLSDDPPPGYTPQARTSQRA